MLTAPPRSSAFRQAGAIRAGTLLAGLLFAGCSSHHVAAPGGTTPLTLGNCWPNANGMSWNYLEMLQPLAGASLPTFADSASVPPVGIDDVTAIFRLPADTVGTRDTLLCTLQFQGDTVGTSGVHAQILLQTFASLYPASAAGRIPLPASLAEWGRNAGVARSRRGAPAGRELSMLANPTFLQGCNFWKTSQRIASWSGVDSSLFSIFLDASGWFGLGVGVGHTFTIPVMAAHIEGMTFTGRVVGTGTATVPGVAEAQPTIQVEYLLDFGVGVAAYTDGVPSAWARRFDCGRITYMAGVGPVADEERIGCFAATPQVKGSYILRLALRSTSAATAQR